MWSLIEDARSQMPLVVERGEAIANAQSYASVQEYLGFIEMQFFKDTGCEPDECKIERALTTAASMLTDRFDWNGCKRRHTQALAWPRDGAVDCEGRCIPCCEVPRQIIEANIILAYQLISGEISAFTNETNAKVQSMNLDKYSVTFAGGGAHMKEMGECGGVMTMNADRFASIRHLIKCFTRRRGAGITIRRS